MPLTCEFRNFLHFFDNFSDGNRFVCGFKDGQVGIWADSLLKSKKIFNHADQVRNATLVAYADNKIFAVRYSEARLHILDLELNTLKVADHQFEKSISVIKPSGSYVAIGEYASGNVVVFDHNGNRLLVSYF